jgi:hypothetical protein
LGLYVVYGLVQVNLKTVDLLSLTVFDELVDPADDGHIHIKVWTNCEIFSKSALAVTKLHVYKQ